MKRDSESSKTAQLILSMFKVGLIGFGGGNALIPLIQSETVDHYGLVDEKEYEEDVLVASLTPGALPVEIAGGVGRRCAGHKGLLLGSCAMALPGVLLTILLSSVITFLDEEVLLQIRFLAVGVTAFIACLLTEYMILSIKQAKENGSAAESICVILLVFVLTCGKNLYRLLRLEGKPPLVLSTIQIFGLALIQLMIFGRRERGDKARIPFDKEVLFRTTKEVGYILLVTLLFLLAATRLAPGTVSYALRGFLSSLMSFGGGDAYLTVADGLFVQSGLIGEGDFYNYLMPLVNILPGSILCKTLAGVGYFIGYENTGSAAGGSLVAATGFCISLLASCGIFDLAVCFYQRFRENYVIQGIKLWIRPIVSGLMLTVILSLIIQNQKLGMESELGLSPVYIMLVIYGLDMALMCFMKLKNGILVFLSALSAFIACNLI